MSITTTAPAVVPKRGVFGLVLLAVLLAAIVSTFEATMMYTSLPVLETDLHTDASSVSWVLTGFALVGAASAAISGRLGDVFGRKRVLVILLVLSLAGSMISLVFGSIGGGTILGVIIGRAVQGLAGGLLPLCFGIIREHVQPKQLAIAVSLVAGTAGIAGALGNVVAGTVVDAFGWRYIFVVAGGLAVITIGAAMLLPRSVIEGPRDRVDWIGGVLFAPALALVLFGINVSNGLGWGSPLTLGTIVAGLVILAGWAAWEMRTDQPMVNVRLIGQRNLGLTFLVTALVAGPLGIAGFMGQLIMQYPTSAPVGFGLSAGAAGLTSFLCGIFAFAMSILSGRVARNGRGRVSLAIGASVGVLSAMLTVFSAATLHSFPLFVVSQLVLSVATSFQLAALPTLVVESAPARNTSEATGVYQVVQNAFIGVGTSVGTAILAAFVIHGTPFASVAGYYALFGMSAVLCGIGFVISLLLRRPKLFEHSETLLEVPLSAEEGATMTVVGSETAAS
jgi:MFS family permease